MGAKKLLKKILEEFEENIGFYSGFAAGSGAFIGDFYLASAIDPNINSFYDFVHQPHIFISSLTNFILFPLVGYLIDKRVRKTKQEYSVLESLVESEEQTFQKLKAQFNSFVEALPVPVYVLNKDFEVVDSNHVAKSYLNYTLDKNYTLEDLLNIDDKTFKEIKETINDRKAYFITKEFVVDHSKKSAKVIIFPVYDLKGNIENILLALIDLTKEEIIRKDLEETVKHLIRLTTLSIDVKDHYTYKHSLHVANYSLQLAKLYNERVENVIDLEKIYYAGLLHDIGKIYVPDEILKKPGKLTPEEYEEMKKHTIYGYKILKDVTTLEPIPLWVRYHHENYDGTGYEGLIGEDIPLESRIMRVADVFDALVTERPYKKPLSVWEAAMYIAENRGTLFDPKIVDLFVVSYEQLWKTKDEDSFEEAKKIKITLE